METIPAPALVRCLGLAVLVALAIPEWLVAQDTTVAPGTADVVTPVLGATVVSESPPPAVMRAAVRGVEVSPGGSANGGDLIIEWIEKPVATAAELAAAVARPPELTEARKAAMAKVREAARSSAPAETLLFTPRVTAFDGAVSLVEWFSMDRKRGYVEAAAWVKGPDLSGTIRAVGDLEVPLPGTARKRRYLLTPTVIPAGAAGWRAAALQPPSPAEFGESPAAGTAILMERGDASDARLMEPLRALLAVYSDPGRSAKITADALALKAAQAAAAEAEAQAKAHPGLPEPSVIRFYTSQDDEIPVLEQAAKSRRAAAASAPGTAAEAFPDISGSSIPAIAPAK